MRWFARRVLRQISGLPFSRFEMRLMSEMGTLRTAIPIHSTTRCEEFTRKSIRGIAQNKTRVNKTHPMGSAQKIVCHGGDIVLVSLSECGVRLAGIRNKQNLPNLDGAWVEFGVGVEDGF